MKSLRLIIHSFRQTITKKVTGLGNSHLPKCFELKSDHLLSKEMDVIQTAKFSLFTPRYFGDKMLKKLQNVKTKSQEYQNDGTVGPTFYFFGLGNLTSTKLVLSIDGGSFNRCCRPRMEATHDRLQHCLFMSFQKWCHDCE